MNNNVAVIGAGMSGMVAAIFAARAGCKVTVFDGNNAPGKKILKTGSGRCNFSNFDLDISHYHTESKDKVKRVLDEFNIDDTLAFFRDIGVEIKQEGSLFYPYSNQAKSVRDSLVMAMDTLGIKSVMQTKVEGIKKGKEGYSLLGINKSKAFSHLIVSTGGLADPKSGSNGFGYELAAYLRDELTDLYPALVPLLSNDKTLKKAAGTRIDARVTLGIGSRYFSESGNLQITDFGISGICTMQLSGIAIKAIEAGKRVNASLDFTPDIKESDLVEMLKSRMKSQFRTDAYNMLMGLLPDKLINPVLKKAGILADTATGKLTDTAILALVETIKNYTIQITGTKGYEAAQCTLGGVDMKSLQGRLSLESNSSGIYYCGEVLDVCGDCGGYNLQWAISSGAACGRLISESI